MLNAQQVITINICNRKNIFGQKFQKIEVILFFKENILTVISSVENMIKFSKFNFFYLHTFVFTKPFQPLKG
jgi:hypothetical protein